LVGDVKQPKTKFGEERGKGWDAKNIPLPFYISILLI